MESEFTDWLLPFLLFGGAIYTGSRYGRLAVEYERNRFIYAALGFVGFIAAVQLFGALLGIIGGVASIVLALVLPVIAGTVAVIGYKILKRYWSSDQT